MEILPLKYFYALAESQHVTKTAQQLHIAQPALTQTIRRLEKELGVKLFKTSGRNIVLTEYGMYLQKKLGPVLKALDEIPDDLRDLSASRKKLIRLNVLAASNMITETVIEFKKSHEDVNFIFVQNNEEQDADITIFTREFFVKPRIEADNYQVFTEKIFLAVPKDSEYAKREAIDLSEMAGKPFISLAGSRSLRSICDRFCMHAGFKPNVVFESDSPTAVQNLIGASQGVGFWPHYSWGNRDESHIALIPITSPVCQRDIVIQLHDNDKDSELVREYFGFLTKYFESRVIPER